MQDHANTYSRIPWDGIHLTLIIYIDQDLPLRFRMSYFLITSNKIDLNWENYITNLLTAPNLFENNLRL